MYFTYGIFLLHQGCQYPQYTGEQSTDHALAAVPHSHLMTLFKTLLHISLNIMNCLTLIEHRSALKMQVKTSEIHIDASNTSGLSITEMAACIPHRSDKFIGCHFFNPAQIMKLVEVTRAIQTSDETFQTAFDLMTSLGKTPVAVKEGPGFVVNRILIPMMNEAMGIVADGIASPADVDVAMQLGAGMKSGPLHTADLVGHDVNLAIMETLYRETGDPKYRPHPLMRQMVRAGWLGVKTGKGFFDYDGPFGKEIVKK